MKNVNVDFSGLTDVKKLLFRVQEKFDSLEEENLNLRKQIRFYNKEEEIQKREETIKDLRERALYLMSDKEWKDYNAFREKHYKVSGCKNPNHYIFDLIGTEIGVVIKVTCPVCGETKDITDFKDW